MRDELLSAAEVARMLEISKQALYMRVNSGSKFAPKSQRVKGGGGTLVFRRGDVEDLIEEHGTGRKDPRIRIIDNPRMAAFHIEERDLKDLDTAAERFGKSRAACIREAVLEWLDKEW